VLDNETKRRIDTARDVLVGKVPDPKSQVEQITIALIYKFMDDMDKEAVDMGGKASFFVGDYRKYAWSQIFAPKLSGFDMLALYEEAIRKMSLNADLPQLFRDIFKNAYLPYRDPETLKLFLKTINEFNYDHSEKLGDAFEYLLSVLGSQGDAGQFRTPRHIIDFMVQVVAPQKNETILDPACGTAGFLISSFKYILRENTKKTPGDKLKTDERKKLLANFKGYDISPDMVRLSLVNLYLHGFVQPQILEYDTLTSEDRWNEYADVIMANPPFMSPKGGIKPHKKFSVQSNRSEVLFVDYIAEHLRPTGRAAIIVPEGIIFQSAGAYKQLRKMLVEKYLYAVVSLPAGVFNPYSGVKTSILFLDTQLNKKADSILFVKIENDGFGLGAQRREQMGSDLPDAANVLADYKKAVSSGTLDTFQQEAKPCCALLVNKEKLAEDGEHNLTGERYRIIKRKGHQKWPMVALGDVCEILDRLRKPVEKSLRKTGSYPYYGATGIVDYIDQYIFDEKLVLVGEDGAKWNIGEKTAFIADGKYWVNNHAHVLKPDRNRLLDDLLVHLLNAVDLSMHITGVTVPKLNQEKLRAIKIPLPPLEVQREIVAEIEGYQKLIDGARQVVENWKPQIDIDPKWPIVKLGKIIEDKPRNGYSGQPVSHVTDLKVLTLSATTSGKLDLTKFKYLDEEIPLDSPCRCKKRDIYLQRGNTAALVGTAALFDIDEQNFIYPDLMIRVRADETKIISHYLLLVLQSKPARDYLTRNAVGAAGSMPKINQGIVEGVPIPLPSISIQQNIVSEIEAERKMVDGCRELIAIYEAKIKRVIDKVWDE